MQAPVPSRGSSDTAAPSAAAAGPPLPVQVLKFQQVTGCTPGFVQPSVCARLRGALVPVPAEAALRLALGLAPHWRGPAPGLPTTSVAHWIATATTELVRHAGLPALATPRVQREAGDVCVVRVATLDGLHGPTQALLAALVALAAKALRPVRAVSSPTVAGPVPDGVSDGVSDNALRHALSQALQALAAHALSGKNRLPIVETAHQAGIPWAYLGQQLFRLGHGAHSRWFDSSMTDQTPAIGVALARDKLRCAALLRRQGLPVPPHHRVRNEDEAVAAARRLGLPVVVKPMDLDRGLGVRARLRSEQAVRQAYRQAREHSPNVLVERQIPGEDHRFHVFAGQVYRVRHRTPGGVTGDGRSSVRQLLERLNADPRRGEVGSNAELFRIDLDEDAADMLNEQQLGLDEVPAAGRFVALRSIANVAVGGQSLHVPLERVHPDNLLLAERAVRTLRLDLAAVDLLMPDLTRSWLEVGAGICEVNAKPQFGTDAPAQILAALFPSQGRLPIVMLLGDGPAGGLPALRAAAAAGGIGLGLCEPGGLWVDGRRIAPLPAPGIAAGCQVLLGETDVRALVVQADASLLREGLPSDRIDLLVLGTGPGEDPALLQGLALASQALWCLAPGGAWQAMLEGWPPALRQGLVPQPLSAEDWLPRLLARLTRA